MGYRMVLMRERHTSPCLGFYKVREVDVCGETFLAGTIKWVREPVALAHLNTQEREQRIVYVKNRSQVKRRTYLRRMGSRRRDQFHSYSKPKGRALSR